MYYGKQQCLRLSLNLDSYPTLPISPCCGTRKSVKPLQAASVMHSLYTSNITTARSVQAPTPHLQALPIHQTAHPKQRKVQHRLRATLLAHLPLRPLYQALFTESRFLRVPTLFPKIHLCSLAILSESSGPARYINMSLQPALIEKSLRKIFQK